MLLVPGINTQLVFREAGWERMKKNLTDADLNTP